MDGNMEILPVLTSLLLYIIKNNMKRAGNRIMLLKENGLINARISFLQNLNLV